MWTVQENNSTTETNDSTDSIPIPSDTNVTLVHPFRDFNPLSVINNVTGTAAFLLKLQVQNSRMKDWMSLENFGGKVTTPERVPFSDTVQTLDSRFGVYIPMERLNHARHQNEAQDKNIPNFNRKKRQVSNDFLNSLPWSLPNPSTVKPENNTMKRGRILMLMNPNSPVNETTFDKSKFKKNVLMLVKQPEVPKSVENTLPNISNLISVENNNNIEEILRTYQFKPLLQSVELREVLQSQPAIQRVRDLNNIELAFPDKKLPDNATEKEGAHNQTDIQLQIKRLLEILVAQTRPNANLNGSSPTAVNQAVRQQAVQQQNFQSNRNVNNDNIGQIPVPSQRRQIPAPSQSPGILSLNQLAGTSNTRAGVTANTRQENNRNNRNVNRLVNFRHSGRSGLANANLLNIRATARPNRAVTPRANLNQRSSVGSATNTRQSGASVGSATNTRQSVASVGSATNTHQSVASSAQQSVVPTVRRTASGNNLMVQIRRQAPNQSRTGAGTSRTRSRSDVRPSLTRQVPVSSSRIQSSRTGRQRGATSSRSTHPLVRAVSSRNLRQTPSRSRRPSGTISRRTNQVQTPVRRQFVRRRRPSPPDPFTQRFSAGFQRGSSLLHQPPLNNTGFDGTVEAGGAGFNPFPAAPFGAPFGPGPGPEITGFPGVPPFLGGGISSPFLGPTIL